MKGTFSTTVKIGVRETTAEFLVIKGKGTPLLGHETATLLGVLRIGPLISDVSSVEEPAKRKNKIEQEVLRRVEEAKAVMEKQILEELEKKRSEEQEFQLRKEKQERKERELLKNN